MPDELDPTTARLVSELATQMLPSLTKALNNAVPAEQFASALERTNRMSQDLRSHIEKNIRSSIEDNRSGRSMLIQSMASMLEEFTSLKRQIEKLSDKLTAINSGLDNIIKNAAINNENKESESKNNKDNQSGQILMSELANIQEMLSELVKGLQSFSETYTRDSQISQQKNNNNISDKNSNNNNSQIINEKFITNLFTGLEGVIKSQGMTHSQEIKELSREIDSSQEQNNIALNHEIREAINEELANFMNSDSQNKTKRPSSLIIKILAAMSGTCIIFMGVIIYLLLR
ncbi:MAG: hypothetical protein IJS99_09850 [Synergistaceae bacterium]|nr:hypothetical protein [Synergistaceae bacterium]